MKSAIVLIALLLASTFALPFVMAEHVFDTYEDDHLGERVPIDTDIVNRLQARLPYGEQSDTPITGGEIEIPIREPVTAAELVEDSGLDVQSDLDEFDARGAGIITAIVFSGPDLNGVLLERKLVAVKENGEKTIETSKVYKGRMIVDGQKYKLRGTDLSGISFSGVRVRPDVDVRADIAAAENEGFAITAPSAARVTGTANFNFAEKVLVMSYSTGEAEKHELDEVIRRAVRKTFVADDEHSFVDVPFWKKWFVRDGDIPEGKLNQAEVTDSSTDKIKKVNAEAAKAETEAKKADAQAAKTDVEPERRTPFKTVRDWFNRFFATQNTQ